MRPYISSMRNGVRNRGISWSGLGRTLLVEILVLLALSFAVVRYQEWSSDANQAEFMSATKPSASDPNHSGEFSTPIQMPIFANMVGPPNVATRIKASMAARHSAAS
jgi:hypothetical protein